MVPRRGARWLLALAFVVLAAAPALAASVGEVVEALRRDGLYVEPGAEEVDVAALRRVLDATERDVRPVVLAEAPPGGEEALAEELLDNLPGPGTVLVISPDNIRVATTEADHASVERALDEADAEVGFDRAGAGEIAEAFALAFDRAAAEPGGRAAQPAGGLPVGALLLAGGLALAAVLASALALGRHRARQQRRARMLAEARQEVRDQAAVTAEQVAALTDCVELSGNPETARLFAEATRAHAAAREEADQAASAEQLERVSDGLDRARWQLESVVALVNGRQAPPPPARVEACFFDPNHGAGAEEATIDTATEQRQVRVCRGCAAKLRAGKAPQPRMISVDGQHVPAAKAPRWYGGRGMGRLEDFAVIVGGRRQPYGWGSFGRRPRRRPRRRHYGRRRGYGGAATWSGFGRWAAGGPRRRASWSGGGRGGRGGGTRAKPRGGPRAKPRAGGGGTRSPRAASPRTGGGVTGGGGGPGGVQR
jgi:hypothetical protein